MKYLQPNDWDSIVEHTLRLAYGNTNPYYKALLARLQRTRDVCESVLEKENKRLALNTWKRIKSKPTKGRKANRRKPGETK